MGSKTVRSALHCSCSRPAEITVSSLECNTGNKGQTNGWEGGWGGGQEGGKPAASGGEEGFEDTGLSPSTTPTKRCEFDPFLLDWAGYTEVL